MTIRVVVVEDHAMVARGLAGVLDAERDIEVVAVCATAAEGARVAAETRPDVVLADQRLPDGRGTGLASQVRALRPPPAVLIVTADPEAAVAGDAIAAGCSGLISKTRTPNDLVTAVREVAAGQAFFAAALVAGAVGGAGTRAIQEESLTRREVEVLQLLTESLSNKAIGRQLHLSTNTVGNHVQSLMAKLGAHTRLEAVMIAIRTGIVGLPDGGAGGR